MVELANTLGKWLFIAIAPVLLIVTASYFQAGNSYIEPLVGLALVSGIFAGTRLLSARVHDIRVVDRENDPVLLEATAGSALSTAETWNLQLERDDRKLAVAKEETRRENQRQAERWRQANPWGGYNPHE